MLLIKSILWFVLSFLFFRAIQAEPETVDDLDLLYGSKQMQSIAAGHSLPQSLSPSVTSILTSRDIERIGARRLLDVLEYLPGVHVSNARSGNTVIGFRGIYSETNAQVLILINGFPLRNVTVGGKPLAWNMPVKNISHVEVIRGPGSMLYGGDAITGVINVVLKSGKELEGGNAGTFLGSQDTYEGYAQYGHKTGDWEFAFSLQGGTTSGSRGLINRDAQTYLDALFGTNVSNAPSFTNDGRDDIDARIDIGYQDWLRFRAGYQRFNNVQTGEGAALALDTTGATNVNIYNVDLSSESKLSDNLGVKSTFNYLGQHYNLNANLLPAGTFGGQLPNGAQTVANLDQGAAALTTQLNYTGIKKHNFMLGSGLNYYWTNNIRNEINYLIAPSFIQPINLTEVSAFGNDPVKRTRNRTNYYALFQDEWNFATDFYLTTGLRYDLYSDADSGFSPRVSLVWNASNTTTAKLYYSKAFRPPSFLEKNEPARLGQVIRSETIDTVELQVEKRWSPALFSSTNVYWFNLENLITSTSSSTLTSISAISPNPVAFTNAPAITGIGVEAEGRYAINDTLTASVNYSYHGVSHTDTTGLLPAHMAKALLNWEFTKNWSIGTQLDWIGERKRPANDPRPNLPSYFIVGLTLTSQIAKPLAFSVRVNNLFGVNAREPSLLPTLLPGDVPVLERSILGQIKWSF